MEADMLHVGFARVDITPEPGLPMVGMPGSPRGEGVMWPLHGRVVLVDDGAVRAAVVSLDLIALVSAHVAELRAKVAAAAGLALERVLIACSHTHRAPFTETGWGGSAGTVRPFLDMVFARVAAAA